jgi:hypothetical protein
LPQNLLSFALALQRFHAVGEAVPLCAIRRINSDRGQDALLGFWSLGLSLRLRRVRSISLLTSPLVL